MNITPEIIGKNIRRLRMNHQETQETLGDLLGFSATAIANYEKGYRLPDLLTFIAIAKHYNASIEDFLIE